jgi:flagellar hook-length control protein FliK
MRCFGDLQAQMTQDPWSDCPEELANTSPQTNNRTADPDKPTDASSHALLDAPKQATMASPSLGETPNTGSRQTCRQSDDKTGSKRSFSIPPNLTTLALLPFMQAQGLRNATVAIGTGLYTKTHGPGPQQTEGRNLYKSAQSAKTHTLGGIKSTLGGIPKSFVNGPNKPRGAETTRRMQGSPGKEPETSKLAANNSKPAEQASSNADKADAASVMAACTPRKTPLLANRSGLIQAEPAGMEEPSTSPKKTLLVAEKPTDNKTTAGKGFPESLNCKTQADSSAGNFARRAPDILELQRYSGPSKDPGRSASGNGPGANFEHLLSANHGQMTISEQSSAAMRAATATNHSPPGDGTAGISQQIMESIQSSLGQADKHITISLYPPELGKVVISLKEQEDQLTGLLEVSKAETRYQIEQALPQIVRSLQDQGVQLRRLDVQLSEHFERQASRDSSSEDGAPWHQNFSSGQSNPENGPTYEWLPETFRQSYSGDFEPQMVFSNHSIDMLV